MIVLKFANLGSGKTTDIARIVHRELKKMKRGKSAYKHIITNTPVRGAIYISDIREVLKKYVFEECLILIDEASIVYNNRLMKMTDTEIEFFKLSRHYLCDIYIYSQSYEDVDITLRRMYEEIYIMKRKPFGFTSSRRIFKRIDISEEGQIVDMYDFGGLIKTIQNYKLMWRPKYYHMFDSFWRPNGYKLYPVQNIPAIEGKQQERRKGMFAYLKLRVMMWIANRKLKKMFAADEDIISLADRKESN